VAGDPVGRAIGDTDMNPVIGHVAITQPSWREIPRSWKAKYLWGGWLAVTIPDDLLCGDVWLGV
jgi:hypothetical protein